LKVSTINPNPSNPRVIKDDKFKKLKKSIEDFPQMMELRPIVVNEDNIILGGNMRLRAIQDLGMKDIPDSWVKKASDLTPDQQREFIVKDNSSFGEWDWDTLANEWDAQELAEWGLDIPKGFQQGEAEEDDYEQPEDLEVDVVLGDLIEIGQHRLLCGDSTDEATVKKLMGGVYPDLINSDPPYGVNAVSKSGVLSKTYKKDILNDSDSNVAKESFLLIQSMYPKAKQVWWGANHYCSVLPDSECWLVWDKNNGGSDQTDCELAWANFRSTVRQFTQSSEKTNRVHPTQKPPSLIVWIIKRFKLTSKTLADYFGGSGVSMVVAHQMGVIAYLMELDPYYCQVIIDRMTKLDDSLVIKINGKVYEKELV